MDPRPQGTSKGVNLKAVARIGWAAALCGVPQLAESCAARAATAQDIGPRAWAELTRIRLGLLEAALPEDAAPSGGEGAVARRVGDE